VATQSQIVNTPVTRGQTDPRDAQSVSSPSGRSGEMRQVTLNPFSPKDERVGKYRIIAELGRGGAASVHLAVASGTGGVQKLVVLKALHPELSEDSNAASAFLEEARLAAQLNHPNVVQTYEVGVEGGRHVIVMEYLEGQSLSRVISTARQLGQPLDEAMHLRILIEMLEGLDYAHGLKGFDGCPLQIVHRDISPQNVFVTYDGQVKILDFGIAKASTTSTHTDVGILKGKIAYMSPEQITGAPIDKRWDIYSVGCMLWAAVTGRKMWQDCNDVQIVRELMAKRIPSPRSVNPDCPVALERIIMKALAADPSKRYETARALQTDLEQYAETLHRTVKQRDIGRCLMSLFGETRAAFNARMEHELVALLAEDSANSLEIDGLVPRTQRSEFSLESGSKVVNRDSREGAQQRSHARRWALGLTVVGLLLGGTVAAMKARPTQSASSPGVSVQAPIRAKPAAESNGSVETQANGPDSRRIVIKFHADPPETQLIVDGSLLAGERMEMTMVKDGKLHDLRADADGYEPLTRKFEASSSTTLDISLTRKKGAAHRALQHVAHASKVTAPAATVAQASPPPPLPKTNTCDNPFFVDADGIKRVRPGCM
jgi:eukaryotic-like serine/threonine-protein kinase